MNDLAEKIEQTIAARNLLPDSGSIVIAVSSGIDSMVLLQVLHQLAPRHEWKLTVACFNHRLRGNESDQDEHLVAQTAERLGLKFLSEAGNVRAFAKKTGDSVEMAARALRHSFLARVARKANARHIVLAHHANDQAELFLIRLLRGTKGEGLGGMKWQNASPADSSIQIVRPMLDIPKSEIAEYAQDKKISFREDSTNLDSEILRNYVRHEVIPFFKTVVSDADALLFQAAQHIGEQNEALRALAQTWLRNGAGDFDLQPVALQRTILHEQLVSAQIAPTFHLIENLRSNPEERFSVSPGRRASRHRAGHLMIEEFTSYKFSFQDLRIEVGQAGSAFFSHLNFRWNLLDHPEIEENDNAETFDASRIGEWVTLRHWQPGDRFQPIGFSIPAKLQNLFTNAKIDASEKRRRVVAAASNGLIFWVEGLRPGELFKLTSATKHGLRWSWDENGFR